MHEIICAWKKLRELRGKRKKSKFTQLRGGLNVRQIFWNFDTWSKITQTFSLLIQIGF